MIARRLVEIEMLLFWNNPVLTETEMVPIIGIL